MNNWEFRKRLTATECLRHSWLQIKPLPKETPKAAPPKEVSELIPAPESSQPLEKPIEKPPEKSTTMAVNSAPSAPEPDSTILPLSSVVEIPVQVAESQPASKPVPKDQTNNQPTNQTRIKVFPVDGFILYCYNEFLVNIQLQIFSANNSYNFFLSIRLETKFCRILLLIYGAKYDLT